MSRWAQLTKSIAAGVAVSMACGALFPPFAGAELWSVDARLRAR